MLYVPIGMGSGACGCIAARDALGLRTEIVGVQSVEAPAHAISLEARRVVSTETAVTLADGLATRVPEKTALEQLRRGLARVVLVTTMRSRTLSGAYWTDTHNVAEGAGLPLSPQPLKSATAWQVNGSD